MNRLLILAFAISMASCSQAPEPTRVEVEGKQAATSFGEKIEAEGIVSTAELMAKLETTEKVSCTFTGVIQETCVKKGCWMTMDVGTDESMRVTFKDYGFFVPVEGQSGKKAVVRGFAEKITTDVDMLRHYAEDAGKSEEEMMAITEPEVSVGFEADGVLIYD